MNYNILFQNFDEFLEFINSFPNNLENTICRHNVYDMFYPSMFSSRTNGLFPVKVKVKKDKTYIFMRKGKYITFDEWKLLKNLGMNENSGKN